MTYESPRITELGSLSELTSEYTPVGAELDATFPAGTPFNQLTWTG